MKQVNKTLIKDTESGDVICFGGKSYMIGVRVNKQTVDLAPVGRDQKITGPFETYELI